MLGKEQYYKLQELKELGLSKLKVSEKLNLSYKTVCNWWDKDESFFESFEKEHEFVLDNYRQYIIEILKRSTDESFVLLDEICAGTDPIEGAVLARCILEKLKDLNVTSVITTHYGELKVLEYNNSYFKNASVEFDTETLKPTYKLLIGIPGLSNAISIASNLGLNSDIINNAKSILLNQKDISIDVVEKLQETHHKLSKNLNSI